ncbi:hypothetical protein AB0G04_08435 [Actinoplanes sp. NPDC023801]|uniref:hypothetical protein n=1 Tax=Actinoplanes sp. NPDC023801 TaxID=3154595 RepID=UPI0033CFD91F
MSQDPLFHSIVATDVEKSGDRGDNLLLQMRTDLWRILTGTLTRQGIDVTTLTTLDDGDGYRFLLPASIPPHSLIEPFLGRLGIELRRHREAASAANRLRLRVAVHSGLLYRESGGSYTGTPLKDCARLLDAPAGRELLAGYPDADMVVLLSDAFHGDVIAGGTSLDPAWFRRIPITVKEADRHGWAYLPGVVPPREPEPPAPAGPRPAPVPSRSSAVNIRMGGSNNANSIDTVIGGDHHGRP